MKQPPIVQEIVQGRLLGHPIHAMFAHFPAALFPISFLFELIAALTGNALLASASFYGIGAGLLGGLIAATFGAIDYFNIPNYTRRWKVASRHALINTIVLLGFSVFFAIRWGRYPDLAPFSGVSVMIMGILAALVIYSNFLGGELVYRHHLGVIDDDMPNDDGTYSE